MLGVAPSTAHKDKKAASFEAKLKLKAPQIQGEKDAVARNEASLSPMITQSGPMRLSELFQLSVRTDKLSWRHYYEVASLKLVETVKDKKLPQGRMTVREERKGAGRPPADKEIIASSDLTQFQETLEQAGISEKTAFVWQKVARVPEVVMLLPIGC